MIERAARALAREHAAVRWESWSELAREMFRSHARAVLAAVGVLS
jgi:hypothetical protein